MVHTYAPAYTVDEFDEIVSLSDHLVFNSLGQLERFASTVAKHPQKKFGLRLNPRHSEVKTQLYDPCAPYSRLGITRDQAPKALPPGITGLHFHTLCELGSDSLARTLKAIEDQFADWLRQVSWVNFGGGHAITHENYDREQLVQLIIDFRQRYNVDVYL